MKQALLVMLLVIGCAWLMYQINHPGKKPDNYGGLPKPVEQYGLVSLGRKGTPSWLYEIQFPTLGKVHIGEPEKINGARNDKNSGNIDDRSSRSESDDKGEGNLENSKIPFFNDSQSNEKEAEVQIRGSPNGMQLKMRMNTEPDGSIKENEEVEEPKTLAVQDWAHIFDDENGVPPDVNDTEAIGGEAQIMIEMVHDGNISNDSKENGEIKSNLYEVKSSSSENENFEVTLRGSKSTGVIVDPDVNSQSAIAHVDT